MTKNKLQIRVDARRRELDAEQARLEVLHKKLSAFVTDVRSRAVIYNLLKNLSIWKELEDLIAYKDKDTSSDR